MQSLRDEIDQLAEHDRRLVRHNPRLARIALVLAASAFETGFYWVVPLAFRYLIDHTFQASDRNGLLAVLVLLAVPEQGVKAAPGDRVVWEGETPYQFAQIVDDAQGDGLPVGAQVDAPPPGLVEIADRIKGHEHLLARGEVDDLRDARLQAVQVGVRRQHRDIAVGAAGVLEAAGLRALRATPELIEGAPYISLADIKPKVSYQIDDDELMLRVTAPPALFGTQRIEQEAVAGEVAGVHQLPRRHPPFGSIVAQGNQQLAGLDGEACCEFGVGAQR